MLVDEIQNIAERLNAATMGEQHGASALQGSMAASDERSAIAKRCGVRAEVRSEARTARLKRTNGTAIEEYSPKTVVLMLNR